MPFRALGEGLGPDELAVMESGTSMARVPN